jgi:tetratricopeptide (TPR) repeat protein
MDRLREAVDDYTKAIALTRDKDSRKELKKRFRALFNRGECYRKMNELPASIDDFLEAIKLEP